jgi:hypothetical protein
LSLTATDVKIGYDNNGGKKVEFKWTPIKLINNRPETLYLDNDIEYLNRVDYIFTNGYDFKDITVHSIMYLIGNDSRVAGVGKIGHKDSVTSCVRGITTLRLRFRRFSSSAPFWV